MAGTSSFWGRCLATNVGASSVHRSVDGACQSNGHAFSSAAGYAATCGGFTGRHQERPFP